MPNEIVVVSEPSEAEYEAIVAPLRAYNEAKGGPLGYMPIAFLLRDSNGANVGGLWGKIAYDWLFVELLFVPENSRGSGMGSKLLSKAEHLAKERNCVGSWLDTYSFQAPNFYSRNGYQVFGTLDDYPRGARRIFYRKLF
jgi:GNAT superfamily N-acetyltransferase